MAAQTLNGLHQFLDIEAQYAEEHNVGVTRRKYTVLERNPAYQFFVHSHPFVESLMSELIDNSMVGLQDADTQIERDASNNPVLLPDGKVKPKLYEEIFTEQRYQPDPNTVLKPYPVKDLDFSSSGPYSVYNWELFFHIPFAIAVHLSRNQRFAEAVQWFHYIFDPTDNSDGPTPERFWKFQKFRTTDVKLIEEILVNMSTGQDADLQRDAINSVKALLDAPFRPHVVARYRPTAYMFKTVMAYLDNLIGWGDSLFRQDSRESINEATQLYILASNILGPKPQLIPRKGTVRPKTYANLKEDLNIFGNALVEFETELPFEQIPITEGESRPEELSTLRSIGHALYFCVPRNEKLTEYWTTVEDRLFKIRNSLNIQGIFRQLPLFQPPIDPALLARGAAAGLDIGAIVSGLNQPLPLVRFGFLIQKATEICQEVKSLGNNLLSALEKKDNEALSILRAKHEHMILSLAETVRYSQWQEAIKSREGLEKSILNSTARYVHYERMLGKQPNDITLPELEALDANALEQGKLNIDEPEMVTREIDVDIAQDLGDLGGGRILSSFEAQELSKLGDAQTAQDVAMVLDIIGGVLRILPKFGINIFPFGMGGEADFGGEDLSEILQIAAGVSRSVAGKFTHEANYAAKIGSYARREQDWAFQSNLAAGEITQTYKQLRAAEIREAITKKEWENHKTQIQNAAQIEEFLTNEKNGKLTNEAFYVWMKREVKGLYTQCFDFAYEIAKKAERALQHELGDSNFTYLQYGYLSGKEGLLAGEKLFYDLKRMEMAYHDLNHRRYELTKQVSLRQLNPYALLQLRTTGRCTVSIPEEVFDMDGPGHYFRRIKTVAITLPSVTGPFTSVNCKLSLLKSSIRRVATAETVDDYERKQDDQRFDDYYGSINSIVTSTGQGDSGLFETNLNDQRYLPFEGSGAVSEWQLELPANPSQSDPLQFDYETITDVIINIRYTAREGGELLKQGSLRHLRNAIQNGQTFGSVQLLSVRHEFPDEWARFKNIQLAAGQNAGLTINLTNDHYPLWGQNVVGQLFELWLLAKTDKTTIEVYDSEDGAGNNDTLGQDSVFGNALCSGKLTAIANPSPVGQFTLYLDDNSIDDLWIGLNWGA